jgi:hypothetical protein
MPTAAPVESRNAEPLDPFAVAIRTANSGIPWTVRAKSSGPWLKLSGFPRGKPITAIVAFGFRVRRANENTCPGARRLSFNVATSAISSSWAPAVYQ